MTRGFFFQFNMDIGILLMASVFCKVFFGLVRSETEFEAAFQGQCESAGTPCEHFCRNHSPRTFECSCREGFHLDHNGYSCLDTPSLDTRPSNRSNNNVELHRSEQADQPSIATTTSPTNEIPYTSPKLAQAACAGLVCLGGGVCASDRTLGYRCLCPLGRKGTHCQEKVSFATPRFSGDSYAMLPLPTDWDLDFELKLEIHAENENGLLLYSGEDLNGSKNFLALELLDGYVVFRLQIAHTDINLQSRYKVPLGDPVLIRAQRSKGDFSLRVASEDRIVTSVQDVEDGELKASENIYLGGIPDYDHLQTKFLTSTAGFVGCILSLLINGKKFLLEPLPFGTIIHGINIDRCETSSCEEIHCLNDGQCIIDHFKKARCDCPIAFRGEQCEIDLQLEVTSFNGTSYLAYPLSGTSVLHATNLLLTFKPSNITGGVLLHIGRPSSSLFTDTMQIRLNRGLLELALDLGEGPTISQIGTPLVRNQWYQVAVRRTDRFTELILDGGGTTQVYYDGAFDELNVADDHLYIGGVDNNEVGAFFQGCIDLNKSEFMGKKLLMSRALKGSNLDTCRST